MSLDTALGLVATLFTTSLVGQQSPAKKDEAPSAKPKSQAAAQAPAKQTPRKVGPITAIPPEEWEERKRQAKDPVFQARKFAAEEARLRKTPGIGSSFSNRAMEVSAKGNEVAVSASVWMYAARPTQRYRWTLRVHEQILNVTVIDRTYDDQIFSLPAEKLMEPKFADVVRVEPGEYRVELILDEFPPDFDLAKLDDPKVERKRRVLSNIQKVTVE